MWKLGRRLWWWILMSHEGCLSVCVCTHAFFPSPFLPFPKPPLLLVSPPTPLSPPSVSQFCSTLAEAHSCVARLSVKDLLWPLFGLQHAELQVTLWNWAKQINSIKIFSEVKYYIGFHGENKLSWLIFISGNCSGMLFRIAVSTFLFFPKRVK